MADKQQINNLVNWPVKVLNIAKEDIAKFKILAITKNVKIGDLLRAMILEKIRKH